MREVSEETKAKLAEHSSRVRVENAVLRSMRFVLDEVRIARLSRAQRIAFGRELCAQVMAEVESDERDADPEVSP